MTVSYQCAWCGCQLPNRRYWYHWMEVAPDTLERVCEDVRRCMSLPRVNPPPAPPVRDEARESRKPAKAGLPQLPLL